METTGAHAQGLDDAMSDQPDYLKLLHQLATLFDRAMGDEGIPAATRDRVRNRVLYGTPTPDGPEDWAEVGAFDELRDHAVAVAMGDDSSSGPGWPLRPGPPVNAAGW